MCYDFVRRVLPAFLMDNYLRGWLADWLFSRAACSVDSVELRDLQLRQQSELAGRFVSARMVSESAVQTQVDWVGRNGWPRNCIRGCDSSPWLSSNGHQLLSSVVDTGAENESVRGLRAQRPEDQAAAAEPKCPLVPEALVGKAGLQRVPPIPVTEFAVTH